MSINKYSPIILVCYKRVAHLKKTLQYLEKNIGAADSDLYIFIDGPKNKSTDETINVRKYVSGYNGKFKNIFKIFRSKNLGLAKNIVQSVSEVINKHNKAIVLEDDVLTSRYFLQYMNDALNFYGDTDQVMHVSGYMYPVNTDNFGETFFLNQASCWGWGTWKRAWLKLNTDPVDLLTKLTKMKKLNDFSFNGWSDFLTQLQMNIDGNIKTWAIKWYASIVLNNGLCLHPNISLTRNIGFDGSGENCVISSNYLFPFSNHRVRVKNILLTESILARTKMLNYYQKSTPKFRRIIMYLYNKLPFIGATLKYVRNLRNH